MLLTIISHVISALSEDVSKSSGIPVRALIMPFESVININAIYYPLYQLYLSLVEHMLNGYFSEISEVAVIKAGKLISLWY